MTPKKEPIESKKDKRKIAMKIAMMCCICIFMGISFIACNRQKESAEPQKEVTTVDDSLTSDALKIAALEAQRLDSLRRDSIRLDSIRRNFRSPDLSFHDLKGPVKRCEIASSSELTYIDDPVLDFNEKGEWVNDGWKEDRQIVKEEYPELLNSRIKRDAKGFIVQQKYLGDFEEMCTEKYVWKNDRVVEARNADNPSLHSSYRYKGDLLTEKTKDDSSEAFKTINTRQKYSYTDFDDMGNWTKRKVEETVKGQEWDAKKPFKETKNYYETRKITYF